MHPMMETLLTQLIGMAISAVPALVQQFADATKPNPTEPDPTDPRIHEAVSILSNAIAVAIAHTAYQAAQDRPHVSRREDRAQLPSVE